MDLANWQFGKPKLRNFEVYYYDRAQHLHAALPGTCRNRYEGCYA